MAGRGTTISRNFDKFKKQGMSDDEAMLKAIGLSSKAVLREAAKRAKDKKRRTTSRLYMALTGKLKPKSHSPAGRRYLKRRRRHLKRKG
jgi:hypothetical protein